MDAADPAADATADSSQGWPDPLERAWSVLFAGDGPGQQVLTAHGPDAVAVVSFTQTGRTRPRTVDLGGRLRTFDVPELAEELGPHGPIAAVAEALRPGPPPPPYTPPDWGEPPPPPRRIYDGSLHDLLAAHLQAPLARALLARDEVLDCYRCTATGRSHPLSCTCRRWDGDTVTDADPSCARCAGAGVIHHRCATCAGTGRRRLVWELDAADRHGHRTAVPTDLHQIGAVLLEHTHRARRSGPAPVFYTVELDPSGPLADLAAAGLDVTASGEVVRIWAGAARHGGWAHHAGTTPEVAIEKLHATFRSAVVADPEDYLHLPAPPLDARPDEHGRVRKATVELFTARRPAEVWQELSEAATALTAALPAGWAGVLTLRTGFIATGEHGPHVHLLARPPHLLADDVAVADSLEHGLYRTLESLAAAVRHLDLDAAAAQAVAAVDR